MRLTYRLLVPSLARRAQLAAAALLASTAPALGACGGHAATKQDVIARGDAICQAAFRDAHAIPPPAWSTNLRSLASYLDRVTPIVEHEVAQLRALPLPAQDRQLLERYLSALAASAADYRALAAAARRGNRDAVSSQIAALGSGPAISLAARYGLNDCAVSATNAGAS